MMMVIVTVRKGALNMRESTGKPSSANDETEHAARCSFDD